VFALWLALLFHSMLEFPYAHAFFLLPAALLAGAVVGAPNTRQPPRYVVASRPALALGLLTALLLGATASDYLQFETEFRANRFDKANFIGNPSREAPAELWVLDQLDALNASAHYQIRAGMPAEELRKLGLLARRFHLLPTRFSYAKALALNGRMAEAQAEMQTIRSIYHPSIYERIEQEWQDWLRENKLPSGAASR
jgi:hypothetical protein